MSVSPGLQAWPTRLVAAAIYSRGGARRSNVSFSSDPEDVATDVRGTGVSCADAEAFVRKIGGQVSSQTGPAKVEMDGYTCTRVNVRSGDHGPALGTFDCANGALKITFVRALVT